MRPIAPLDLPDITPANLTGIAQPDFDLVDPGDLLVDDAYQRDLSPKSVALIRRIVEGFRWSKFKPPICVRVRGKLHVIDGQHTAIAAATHPDITVIPVVVVDEPDQTDRAKAFVSHARDRLSATPGQVWRAEVAAGDEDAVALERVCRVARVDLVAFPPAGGAYRPGQTIALASIRALLKRRGEEDTALVLAALADCEMAPISADAIKAAEALLFEPEYAEHFDSERLVASFKGLGPRAYTEAKELAAAKDLPLWRALVVTVFKHRRGKSPSPRAAALPAKPTARVAARPPEPALYSAGDPPPGRSALDQQVHAA